ncbi:glycosyltransferase [Rhodohalobacter sp. 8-1]|uniref:glycosyltransferase n=1 Tax=Rhodohalobacter sp. 8-1 TaxID=3131972 RepID=UPI0030EF0FD8
MSQTERSVDLSIIIVNYNVKEFLANCLQSVRKASKEISTEVFVVDNDSSDGSIPFLKKRFDDVTYIENRENVGFGKANNQAIEKATGTYTLLLNPDTLLQEDTLDILIGYMSNHDSCGACGCKILNPDGTFAPESRRAIPTVSAAIYKAIGLTALFPNNKHFGAYYQGWKGEDERGEVPVLSGSFMFFRTRCLKQVGGFDERFFMYGEDIDLCYRVSEAGWEIHYVPETSIIHYKGESTKKNELSYHKVFNDAIYKFFDKHYTSRYSHLFKFLIFWAIQFRALASFFVNNLRAHRFIITDLVVINAALLIGMFIRASFDQAGILSMLNPQFLWLNLIWSMSYLFFAQLYGIIDEHKHSIVGSLKAVLFSFLILVAITFFIRSLAFSRIILAVSVMIGLFVIGFIRFRRINQTKSTKFSRGMVSPLRMLLVGAGDNTKQFVSKIKGKARWQVEIAGVVRQKGQAAIEDSDLSDYDAGSISDLKTLIRTTRSDIVVFLLESVSHKELLESIQNLRNVDVEIKVIPQNMNFIIGKADVEYLDDIAVVDLELPFFNPIQKLLKRSFDLVLGCLGLLVLLPLSWACLKVKSDSKKGITIFDGSVKKTISLTDHHSFASKICNRLTLCYKIAKGDISVVGSAAGPVHEGDITRYKTGLTGYVQINRDRITNQKDREQFDLHYLQNYSIWLDLDILFKALIREDSLTGTFLAKSE